MIDKARSHVWKPKLHEIAAGSMGAGVGVVVCRRPFPHVASLTERPVSFSATVCLGSVAPVRPRRERSGCQPPAGRRRRSDSKVQRTAADRNVEGQVLATTVIEGQKPTDGCQSRLCATPLANDCKAWRRQGS